MEIQINDITQWHEIMVDNYKHEDNQQWMVYEDKTYRKSDAVIAFWIFVFILFGWALLGWIFFDESNDDAHILTIWFFIILEIIFIFKIIWAYRTTITVWENSLIYRKWVLFRHKSEISYFQISSVSSSSFLWMWNIEITLLNNELFKYEHVQDYEEVESLINERVKQSRLKVQLTQPIIQ